MTLHHLFVYAAAAGGVLLLVQVALALVGGGLGDADLDVGGHHPGGHPSPDSAFKFLSLQGLTAFFGMFGLIGLAMLHESKADALSAVAAALAGGALTTWVIARIFRAVRTLEARGTVDLQRAVGATGTIYLEVGPGKIGKATILVGKRLIQFDAVADAESLPTGTEVRVTRLLADGSVSVTRASPAKP